LGVVIGYGDDAEIALGQVIDQLTRRPGAVAGEGVEVQIDRRVGRNHPSVSNRHQINHARHASGIAHRSLRNDPKECTRNDPDPGGVRVGVIALERNEMIRR